MRTAAATTPHAALRTAPRIKGLPLLGILPYLRHDPLGYLYDLAMQHGPLVQLPFGPLRYYLISSPAYITHVLQERQAIYQKSALYERLWPVFGRGLVTSEAPLWRRHRRIMQPAFRHERLAGVVKVIATATEAMLADWQRRAQADEPVDVVQEMTAVTERIMLRALFGDAGGSEAAAETVNGAQSDWVLLNSEIGRRFLAATRISEHLPLPRTLRFRRALRRRLRLVNGLIAARRAAANPGDDLLGMLLSATDEETGQRMSDAEIRDEVMTMFFAGHETTALALAWWAYLMAQHPAAQRRLRRETRALAEAAAPDGRVTAITAADWVDIESVQQLEYARMTVQETMRLYPPAPWIARSPVADDVIDGYPVPRGCEVGIVPWIMHRHPDYWEAPAAFDPERFSAAHSANRERNAYLPFGAGPRQCIGTHFATLEATLIAALVGSRFELSLVDDQPVVPVPAITLRPADDIRIRLQAV